MWFLLQAIYVLSTFAVAVYAGSVIVFVWLYVRRGEPEASPLPEEWPRVVVQLPIYNERYVVDRLLRAVSALDYAPGRLSVQILDDSADDTTERLRAAANVCPFPVELIRRRTREGYKAGALAEGLRRTDADLIAIFDADFVPPPDFLRRIVPRFCADPGLGMVQARWGHLNADANLLTRAQSFTMEGYYVVEKTARARHGLPLTFNGSGGVWRRACIESSGGWQADTLTEDLDLSYRAQLAGWRCNYAPDVVVPAEVPPQLSAYRMQQARWTKGSTRVLFKLGGAVLRSDWRIGAKLAAILYMASYFIKLFAMLSLLSGVPLAVTGHMPGISLAPLGVFSLGTPVFYALAQRRLYPDDWPRRMLILPVVLIMGMGMALTNTLAILGGAVGALCGAQEEFKRTPKFERTAWISSRYALAFDQTTLGEAALAVYAGVGAWLSRDTAPEIVPFLITWALAFALMAGLGGLQALRRLRARRAS